MLKVFGQIDERAEPAGDPVGVYSGHIRAIQLNTFKRPIRQAQAKPALRLLAMVPSGNSSNFVFKNNIIRGVIDPHSGAPNASGDLLRPSKGARKPPSLFQEIHSGPVRPDHHPDTKGKVYQVSTKGKPAPLAISFHQEPKSSPMRSPLSVQVRSLGAGAKRSDTTRDSEPAG